MRIAASVSGAFMKTHHPSGVRRARAMFRVRATTPINQSINLMKPPTVSVLKYSDYAWCLILENALLDPDCLSKCEHKVDKYHCVFVL
jgi:hypothetical protein